MARDETFYLHIWYRYYAGLFGAENIFVVDHNSTEHLPAEVLGVPGLNVFRLPFEAPRSAPPGDQYAFDRERFKFVSNLIAGLLKYYDTVIFNDTDEVYLPDPAAYADLADYLASNADPVIAGIGLEIFHDPREEAAYTPDRPVLAQRRNFVYRFHHSKPHILSKPSLIGGHGSKHPFRIDPDLYLLHLKYLDWDETLRRQAKLRGFFRLGRGGPKSRWRFGVKEFERRMEQVLALPRREGFEHHALLARWLGEPAAAVAYQGRPSKRPAQDFAQLTDLLPAEEVNAAQAVRRVLPERFRKLGV